MRVFVTGGSGFVGSAVLDAMVAAGHSAVALKSRRRIDERAGRVAVATGDLLDSASLVEPMATCDAVIHLVGIIGQDKRGGVTFQKMHVEASRSVIDAARSAGVRRYIHMSALGARPDAPAEYHRTKAAAETVVRASELDWTILRPSMIHGPKGDFTAMLAGWARGQKAPWVFMPYFGRGVLGFGGSGKLQPILVDDVARAFASALDRPQTIGKAYDLAGPDVLTWPDLHDIAARAIVGKPRMIRPLPAWYFRVLTSIVPEKWLMGINRDQVEMSQEDNVADIGPFVRDFGVSPRGFEESIRAYAGQL